MWGCGDLRMWRFEDVGIWGFGDVGMWRFEDVEI
jgi:hypothetical protein